MTTRDRPRRRRDRERTGGRIRPTSTETTPSPSSSSQAFRHVKAKALRALDNSIHPSCHDDDDEVDKSPKGSIDLPILNLVRRLNEHSDYATTSSCSGRIALFDPTGGGCGGLGVRVDAATQPTGETEVEDRGGDGTAEAREATSAANNVEYQSKRNVPPRTKQNAGSSTGGGGKGRGTWLLSSHAPITLEQLESALAPPPSQSASVDHSTQLTLKFEPLVMHVACSSPDAARVLLSTVLGCGYREAGIVFGLKGKITVAIRSHSLAISVPLSRIGPLRPGGEYLDGLVGVLNERFERNAEKTVRLEEAIESAMFPSSSSGGGDGDDNGRRQISGSVHSDSSRGPSGKDAAVDDRAHAAPPPPSSGATDTTPESELSGTEGTTSIEPAEAPPLIEATFRPLPPLRLWGHAAVAVPVLKTTSPANQPSSSCSSSSSSVVPAVDVLAIGGYGVGPPPDDDEGQESSAPCRRVDSVYRLSRDENGNWDDRWRVEPVILPPTSKPDASSPSQEEAMMKTMGFPVQASLVKLPPLQGHAVCLLPPLMPGTPPIVAVFGGRSGGPARPPSDDLYLYCHRHHGHLHRTDAVGGGGGDDDDDSSEEASVLSFFCRPADVRGAPPRPRWGHTFTAIPHSNLSETADGSGEGRHLALVVGGMDETKRAFRDAHVLTLVTASLSSCSSSGTGESRSHSFLWQELDVTGTSSRLEKPLFYHAASSAVPANYSDRDDVEGDSPPPGIFIFGGLCNPAELFTQPSPTPEQVGSVLRLSPSRPCNGGEGGHEGGGEDCGSPPDEHPANVTATCEPISICGFSFSPTSKCGEMSPFSPTVASILGGFGASACTVRRVATTCDDKLPSGTFGSSTLSGYVAVTGGVPLEVDGGGPTEDDACDCDDGIPLAVLRVSRQRRGDGCVEEADDGGGTTAVIPCRVRWNVARDEVHSDASSEPPPLNLGALVHHAAISVEPARFDPPRGTEGVVDGGGGVVDETSHGASRLSDVVLVGGGVPSFGFGPTFAGCYRITFHEVDA